MVANSTHAQRLLARAEEARILAEDMRTAEMRQMMLEIARDYEELAQSVLEMAAQSGDAKK